MKKNLTFKSVFKPKFWLAVVLLTGLLLSSCLPGSGTVATRGWSGAKIVDGKLYLGTMNGRVVSLNTTDGKLLWSVPLQPPTTVKKSFGCSAAAPAISIYGTPAVDGELVYVAGYNGKIYTISAVNQLSRDKYLTVDNTTLPKPIIGSPAVADGKVFVASSDGLVYALDTVSLEERWRFTTGDKMWSTPVVEGDTVYITSFDKKIYALNAGNGAKKWEFKTDGAVVSSPVISGGTVYFGSLDRNMYALNDTDGSQKWKFQGGNWFWANPVLVDGTIYAANLDGKVYFLDAATGQKKGEIDLRKPGENKDYGISSSPVLVGGQLIVATEAGIVYSLDTGNNQQKQIITLGEKVYSPLAASGTKVFIHTAKDNLYEIEANSGAQRQLNIQ